MFERLIEIDRIIFSFINQGLSNDVFDVILPIMRDKYTWIPVYFFIIAFLIYNYTKKSYYPILFLFLTVGMADATSNRLFKKNVQRLRPCNEVTLVEKTVRVRCGSGYSFTSNHAANHFAISTFLYLLFRVYRKKWLNALLFAWAAIVSFSQVYVGVHYPLDILCGAILGIGIGWLCFHFYNKYFGSRTSAVHRA